MPAESLRSVIASMSATVHVSDEEPGVVRLDLLLVPEELRGRGCARDALSHIADWADENATVIVLTATFALGATLRRLLSLYIEYGFIPVEMTPLYEVPMRREPRALIPTMLPAPNPGASEEFVEEGH